MSFEERGPDPKRELTMQDLARGEQERIRREEELRHDTEDYPDHQCILLAGGGGGWDEETDLEETLFEADDPEEG